MHPPSPFFMPSTLSARDTPEFWEVFKHEAEQLDTALLPLQKGLSLSSHVADTAFSVVPLHREEDAEYIRIKAGIFYYGIIAGCSCADDPSPTNEITEHCELMFEVNKRSAEASVTLLME